MAALEDVLIMGKAYGDSEANEGKTRVRYIPTDLNFADCFTKSLTPKKHAEAVKAILGDEDAYRLYSC